MTDDDSTVAALLAGLRSRSGVSALLRWLGHVPRPRRVKVPVYAAAATPTPSGERVLRLAERDGLRVWLIELDDARFSAFARWARRLNDREPLFSHLFVGAAPGYAHVYLGCFGLGQELRHLVLDPARIRASDVEAVREMASPAGEGGVALAARYARALDRRRVSAHFFEDLRAQRERIAHGWQGVPAHAREERERLALLFLCRMLFLYFLQRRGHLAGDPLFLANLLVRWQRSGERGSFYRAVITPLFFGALNRRPAEREPVAAALGELPYLNGGLFERHVLERAFDTLDLPDAVIAALFRDLLERYRFTTSETADDVAGGTLDAGIDPEMLGRVFEGLMGAERRSDTGTYYTPAATVDRVVREVLTTHLARATALPESDVARVVAPGAAAGAPDAEARRRLLRVAAGLTVLDPACGSGAFLMAALARIATVRAALGEGDVLEIRRAIVEHALHGLDVQDDAALLCALRLWLALAVQADADASPVPPLPNLDRRVRQGDALVDPVEAGALAGPADTLAAVARDPAVRRARRALLPAVTRYTRAEPAERRTLDAQIRRLERDLAAAWLAAVRHRLERSAADLRARSEDRDFWGAPTAAARQAAAALAPLLSRSARLEAAARQLAEADGLPFFSFPVHFAAAAERGFDLVLSNPPWVRAHRWPATLGEGLRERYEVCRHAGWPGAARHGGARVPAGQVDLALLFLERSLALCAPNGTLGMILPAKLLRSGYAGGARRMLLRETRLVSIEDHSLDQRSIFDADAFAATLVAHRQAPAGPTGAAHPGGAAAEVRVTLLRRGVEPLRFTVCASELSSFEGDPAAPWLLVPPGVGAVLRRMRRGAPPLGSHAGVRVRRGVVTGANAVMLVRSVVPKLGDLAVITCAGADADVDDGTSDLHGIIEAEGLRPLLRGCDVRAWRFDYGADVLFAHAGPTLVYAPARRLLAFLERNRTRLGGGRAAPGRLQRLASDTLGAKVAWQDIGSDLSAVSVPARVRARTGRSDPVVPLNTVYYIPVDGDDAALLLAAYLNSLPLRTAARAVAERAKDARYRFFATTIASLPLPAGWTAGRNAARLRRIARDAHEHGRVDEAAQAELDWTVARAYGLGRAELVTLGRFDAWLRGDAGGGESP